MATAKTTTDPTPISEYLSVRAHPTVVRLDDLDSDDAGWITDAYHLTGDVARHLESLAAVLSRPSGCGLFLIGPYGSGKSHFLAYTTRRLREGKPLLGEEPGADRAPSPAVRALSLLNYSAGETLEDVVRLELGLGDGPAERGEAGLRSGDRRKVWSALTKEHPDGLLLVIDELSEWLRSKPDQRSFNEDVRFLQFLGEWAQGSRFWVLAAMQEGIEHTGDLEQGLYRKIKDRYPIRYLLTPSHIVDLVSESILVKKPGYDEAVGKLCDELCEALPGSPLDADAFRAIYPLHPATLEVLEEVRDRFSQARGAVDFAVARLAGRPERGIESFLDKPWGSLIGPDAIVDHFRDLFEFQPEFLPIAQQLFPWYQRHLEEVFPRPELARLANRVLSLLVLAHLSPAREGLTADEVTYWLLWSATRIDPSKNLAIVRKVLDTLCERGRAVVLREGLYRIDLEDDGSDALERQLEREKDELRSWGEGLMEILAPLARGDAFDIFSLPRGEWQNRNVGWHFHQRPVAVWLGEGDPSDPRAVEEHGAGFVIRLPWGEDRPARSFATLVPRRFEIGEDAIELAALSRLAERGVLDAGGRFARRLAERTEHFRAQIRGAYDAATLCFPDGSQQPAPRIEAGRSFGAWIERQAQQVLRRRFPSFEEFAPTSGPLPAEAWRRFLGFCLEDGIGSPSTDDLVQLARDAYLVPMKLLKKNGRSYQLVGRPDRHDLVKRVLPLLSAKLAPRVLYEQLAAPVFGLVPDQVRLLLAYLWAVGEIDVLERSGRPLRLGFEKEPDVLEYAEVGPGRTLSLEALRDLEVLLDGFGIRPAKEWTVSSVRRKVVDLRAAGELQSERFRNLIARLESIGQGLVLQGRLRAVLTEWRHLNGPDELAAFESFRESIGSPTKFLATLAGLGDLPERLDRLLADLERLRHLLGHSVLLSLPEESLREDLDRLGDPPTLDEPEHLEAWLKRAQDFYDVYKTEYTRAHSSYWKRVGARSIWKWSPPKIARSQAVGLSREVDVAAALVTRAQNLRCLDLINLDFQPHCACGFDWQKSPVEECLDSLDASRRQIEAALDGFFQRGDVRDKLGQEGAASGGADIEAWLEGKVARPRIDDPRVLDRLLADVETVRDVDLRKVAEFLSAQSGSRAEITRAFDEWLEGFGDVRLRFRVLNSSRDSSSADGPCD